MNDKPKYEVRARFYALEHGGLSWTPWPEISEIEYFEAKRTGQYRGHSDIEVQVVEPPKPAPLPDYPIPNLTSRQIKLLGFALSRFAGDAREFAHHAGQKYGNQLKNPESAGEVVAKFLDDAKDAEELCGILRAIVKDEAEPGDKIS